MESFVRSACLRFPCAPSRSPSCIRSSLRIVSARAHNRSVLRCFASNRNMAKAGEPTTGTEVSTVTLWSFYASSCTWRVRLALGLKGIPFVNKPLNISKGEHKTEEYRKISPLQLVPAVEVDGVVIADSMAIIMYFEETFRDKRPLLPVDLVERATVRQIMYLIGANIQPLQNLGTLIMIEKITDADTRIMWAQDHIKIIEKITDADTRIMWAQDHIKIGFTALEQILEKVAGKYAVGDELTLADVSLVPQIGNAIRFKVDVTR